MQGCRGWTKEEDQIIMDHFSTDGLEACAALLPHRSKNAVRQRAVRRLYQSPRRFEVTRPVLNAPKPFRREFVPLVPAPALPRRPGSDTYLEFPSLKR